MLRPALFCCLTGNSDTLLLTQRVRTSAAALQATLAAQGDRRGVLAVHRGIWGRLAGRHIDDELGELIRIAGAFRAFHASYAGLTAQACQIQTETLPDSEVAEIKKLLKPGRRRRLEALARLRPLVILDSTIHGQKGQPSDADLRRIGKEVARGGAWADVFRGAAAVEIAADGVGPSLSLRLSKKEGIPIQLVAEGTPGASVVAVKRVDELGFYSLGGKQLAENVGLTMPRAVAVVDYLGLRDQTECYKEIKIGRAVFKRYSQKAIDAIKDVLKTKSIDEIWRERNVKAKGSTR